MLTDVYVSLFSPLSDRQGWPRDFSETVALGDQAAFASPELCDLRIAAVKESVGGGSGRGSGGSGSSGGVSVGVGGGSGASVGERWCPSRGLDGNMPSLGRNGEGIRLLSKAAADISHRSNAKGGQCKCGPRSPLSSSSSPERNSPTCTPMLLPLLRSASCASSTP